MPNLTRNQIRSLHADYPQGDPFGGPAFGQRNDPATIAVATPYITAAAGVATVATQTGIIGGSGDTPLIPAPVVEKPTLMPTPDDEAAKAAKRRALATQMQRRGRQSTILADNTQSSDLLGG